MFSVSVVETDSFLDLPLKSQALYLHLCMRSDDDGFSSPKSVIRSIGCTDKDLKPLIDRNFVIPFKSGVVCITDWHANNTIRKDRRTPTAFQLELSQLKETPTGRYSLVENGNHLTTNCQPDVNQLSTEYSKVENSKVKVSVDQYSNAAAAASEPDNPPCDIFSSFSAGDSELLQALRDYDQMRREKRKTLTDTMRRSLCQQLDEEFQPCEWVEIVKQATRQGWLKFYPLDKDKPTATQKPTESGGDQLSRIINNLKQRNGV